MKPKPKKPKPNVTLGAHITNIHTRETHRVVSIRDGVIHSVPVVTAAFIYPPYSNWVVGDWHREQREKIVV